MIVYTSINPDSLHSPAFVIKEHLEQIDGPWHTHQKAQLVYSSDTVVTVSTEEGLWVVPSQRAVWVPSGVKHRVSANHPYTLLTLYCDSNLVPLPEQCRVVQVSTLVRELLESASDFRDAYCINTPEYRLISVLLDRLVLLPVSPLHLPQPKDVQMIKLADLIKSNINNAMTIGQLIQQLGLGERTAARHFKQETGMTIIQWRQQLRLLTAMQRLGEGDPLIRVALDVGYQDVSSFISVFKKFTGETPARYFRRGEVNPNDNDKI